MKMINRSDAIIICGPTASGKSDIAKRYAKMFNGVIINADRMQIYSDLPILSATPEDVTDPLHLMYSKLNHDEEMNVKRWINMCSSCIDFVLRSNRLPIIVGGTGMYINSLVNGLSDIPSIPIDLIKNLSTKETIDLYNDLCLVDSHACSNINSNHRSRIIRALSVKMHTGISVFEYHEKKSSQISEINFIKILINTPKKILIENIIERVDHMLKIGSINEAKNFFWSYPHLMNLINLDNRPMILNTIGLKEILKFLQKEISFEDMRNQIIQSTCQYAKRQNTWFRNKFDYDFLINT